MFRDTPYKLCCTATPAPNDYVELGTHSEFLGVMKQTEMLATYFVHDGGETQKWRLKGHAKEHFFAWVASWACCLNSPKDIGASGEGFDLPPLRMHEIRVEADNMEKDGQMMFVSPTCQTLNERRDARRKSLFQRVEAAAKIANGTDEQVLVWCHILLVFAVTNRLQLESEVHRVLIHFLIRHVKELDVAIPSMITIDLDWR